MTIIPIINFNFIANMGVLWVIIYSGVGIKNVVTKVFKRLRTLSTVEPRLSELIGTAPSSDTLKFGYWKFKNKII